MKKIGDYHWQQLSMWEFAPKGVVQTFAKTTSNNHAYHYVLRCVTEVHSDNSWVMEYIRSLEGVPDDILNWCDGTVSIA